MFIEENSKVATMTAAQIRKYGKKEVEISENVHQPEVSEGELLVEVYAAGINPSDWKIMEGLMKEMAPLNFPATLGGDFSGVVKQVGKNVSGFKKGDEVYGYASVLRGGSGAFSEYATVNVKSVAHKPGKVDFFETAALPLAGVSAWQALVDLLHLSQGQKILIHGGAGGIGSFAIQIAKHIGAYVATTVNVNNIEFAKELGADEVIDYKNQKFEDILKNYDAVFDTVGGETFLRSFEILKKGGQIVSMLERAPEELLKQYGVKAIAQGTLVTRERLRRLAELIDQDHIMINIDKIFPLSEAGEALQYQKKGHPRGKVVLEIKKK